MSIISKQFISTEVANDNPVWNLFQCTLHNTILWSILYIANSNWESKSFITVYKNCVLLVDPQSPQLLQQICSIKLSWGFKSSGMWRWVITWVTPDVSSSRWQNPSKHQKAPTWKHSVTSSTTLLWKSELLQESTFLKQHLWPLAISSSHAFSCVPDDTVSYILGGVLQLDVIHPVAVVLHHYYLSGCLRLMCWYWTFALGLMAWCIQHWTS